MLAPASAGNDTRENGSNVPAPHLRVAPASAVTHTHTHTLLPTSSNRHSSASPSPSRRSRSHPVRQQLVLVLSTDGDVFHRQCSSLPPASSGPGPASSRSSHAFGCAWGFCGWVIFPHSHCSRRRAQKEKHARSNAGLARRTTPRSLRCGLQSYVCICA